MFGCNTFYPFNMIAMLVRDKERLDLIHRKVEPFHAFFGLSARQASIYQHGFMVISYVITVAIAARIEGCDVERHSAKVGGITAAYKTILFQTKTSASSGVLANTAFA